jgi:hypothetical protein
MVQSQDLVVPVYLNQRIVFDLVAVLEGGISSVTQVSHTQARATDEARQVGASLGVSNVLSALLKIDISGKRDRKSSDEAKTTTTQERIHTAVSLFIALRSILREEKYLSEIDATSELHSGDLVEFSSTLNRNPMIETLDSFLDVMEVAQAFSDKPAKGKGKQLTDMTQMKKQMTTLVTSLKSGGTTDLTTPPLLSNHRAVITLENQNLNDPSMSDLVDGTFRVVGKVTRSIKKGDPAIRLNRKSAMGRLPTSALAQLKSALEGPELHAMSLPNLEFEVTGPAIQVLPIAIFA